MTVRKMDFFLDLSKAELEKAKKESDAVDVELHRLLAAMRELREKGQAVAFIWARLRELFQRPVSTDLHRAHLEDSGHLERVP